MCVWLRCGQYTIRRAEAIQQQKHAETAVKSNIHAACVTRKHMLDVVLLEWRDGVPEFGARPGAAQKHNYCTTGETERQ